MNWKSPTFLWPIGIIAGLSFFAGGAFIASLIYKPDVSTQPPTPVGSQTTEDFSITDLKSKAVKGLASAQYELGRNYYDGKGVPQNYSQAVDWFRKAADQGFAKAQNSLAVCYIDGKGVPQDYSQATEWLRKAAIQGDSIAQANLGNNFRLGRGVSQNFDEAVKWLRKAADQGVAQAQCNLGYCYSEGKGVPQDDAEAMKWYLKAAEQGFAQAQINLGANYFTGKGVTQNYTEAEKWWQKAADQGDPEGVKRLKILQESNNSGINRQTNNTTIAEHYSDGLLVLENIRLEPWFEGAKGKYMLATIKNTSSTFIRRATIFIKSYDSFGNTIHKYDYSVVNIDPGESVLFKENIGESTQKIKIIEIQYN